MFTKPALLCSLTALATVVALRAPASQDAPTHEQVCAAEQFLFVQDASSGSFDGKQLTLNDVGPTIFFTDRPYRVFGHTEPQEFVAAWTRGPNSFSTDPPNAVLSLLGDEHLLSAPVVLSNPRYSNGSLTYDVKVEEGKLPETFEHASLFIDNEAWAAVGGFAAGHILARRRDREHAAAYSAGKASAHQEPSYYYNAAPPAPSAPSVPAPPPPPAPAPKPSVTELLSQAGEGMKAAIAQATPENANYIQKLITTLNTVSADFEKVTN